MEPNLSSRPMPMQVTPSRRYVAHAMLFVTLSLAGCSSQVSTSTSTAPNPLQTYVAPVTAGAITTLSIDHSANTFVQVGYGGANGNVNISGGFAILPNSVLNVGVTYANGTLYSKSQPQTNNWVLEWPGQGGFASLNGTNVISPFAPNQTCPSSTTSQTFQFVTFPNSGDSSGTAYGSVSVDSSGGMVNFTNISQSRISGGTPSNPSPSKVAGTCGPTVYGQTISVPNTDTVTIQGSGSVSTPTATIAIGPTGILVEGNGYTTTTSPPTYQNILGAGVGAVGLPQPSGALTTSAMVGAQYVGFLYSTGALNNPVSRIASMGYPMQTACPTLLSGPQASTTIYGGEFTNNDPSSNAHGNCDFAVDLGTQDSKNNGLFPNATAWVGSNFPGNTTGRSYSFPAVAIAGQLQGKYAIFLLGLDAVGIRGRTQDWGIYLLQSN